SLFLFAADNGTDGVELWRTDGTPAGTFVLKDINPGAGSSNPASLTVFNNTLFFTANDGTSGTELWKSDGTAAGTVQSKDIRLGPIGALKSEIRMAFSNGQVFFAAADATHGAELWKTDGTEA